MEMINNPRVGILCGYAMTSFPRKPKSELRRNEFWRRVSRVLLAVIDIVDATQRGGGRVQGAARDPSICPIRTRRFCFVLVLVFIFGQLTTQLGPV